MRHPDIAAWSHVDERSGAFFALGLAKATGRPAVLACTSGTAAANYAPAVHEAREAGVPLLVLTADRPPELREVGAGQVIDQVKLYGSAAKWFFEVGSHDASAARLRWIRALACRAVWAASDGRPGVVHLNFPVRDPLVPPAELPEDTSGRSGRRPWLDDGAGGAELPDDAAPRPAAEPRGGGARLPDVGRGCRRGVVVAGGGAGPGAARWAAAAGWPLLADPLSGARIGPAAIAHYDHLLRGQAPGEPEIIVRAGDIPTSKPLRQWLEAHAGVDQVLADRRSRLHDPANLAAHADHLPVLDAGTTLWVASSMPIRDVEAFFAVRDDGPRVLSNRGANGIDGTVSSALGAAAAGGRVVLLIGDVALAHDLGGLLIARRNALAITIVLLNNDGGGIFEFLPVSGERDVFEEHVATPHGLDFAHAAALFGCEHVVVSDLGAFRDAALPAPDRTRIVEVRTNRAENRALHARVAEAVLGR